jgi:hypothetical protein
VAGELKVMFSVSLKMPMATHKPLLTVDSVEFCQMVAAAWEVPAKR